MSEPRPWENWNDLALPLEAHWSSCPSEIQHRKMLASSIGCRMPAGQKFLDVGCGPGLLFTELVPKHLPVEAYTGIDNADQFIALARKRGPAADFRVADAFSLPFPDKSYDVVGCFTLVSHVPSIKPVLQELWRVASKTVLFTVITGPKTEAGEDAWGAARFIRNAYRPEDVAAVIREVCGDDVAFSCQLFPQPALFTILKERPVYAGTTKHTVILGSYNRPRMVRRAIESVFAQTNPDWQLVIADDGSNEETLQSIKSACNGDTRTLLNPCKDPCRADLRTNCSSRACMRINEALKLRRGQIIHYLADDDWYVPGRFEAFDRLFADPKVVCGYGRLLIVNEHGQSAGQLYPPSPCLQPLYHLDHNQVAHRASTFDVVPEWPTKERGDYALEGHFFNMLARHWPFIGRDEVVSYKVFHPLNMQKTREYSTAKRE